jgi:hypothetical protein
MRLRSIGLLVTFIPGLLLLPHAADAQPAQDRSIRAPLRLNACAGDAGQVSYWARVLSRGDLEQRLRAARALGESRSAAAVPPLLEALKDGSVELRLVAIQALGRIGREARAGAPALTEALRDGHPDIRSEARKALERMGD